MIQTKDKKYTNEILNLLKETSLQLGDSSYVEEEYLHCFLDEGYVFIELLDNKIIGVCIGESLITQGFLLHFAVIDRDYRDYKRMSIFYDKLIDLLKEVGIEYIVGYTSPGIEQIAKRKGFIVGKKYTEIFKFI